MTKLNVYGLDNKVAGDFTSLFSCRWTVEGSLAVSGNGPSTISVSDSVAVKPWLDLGRMVTAHPDSRLPVWGGVIDLPWKATLPVQVSIHPLAYLLSWRSASAPELVQGNIYQIAAQIIERINAQGELFVRLGVTSGDDITRQETLDTRNYWEQLRALVVKAGKEMFLRPEKDGDGRLIVYVDIRNRIGVDGGFLYHDGKNANIQVLDANLDGQIINMLTGTGSQSTSASLLTSDPQINQTSVDRWRLRSGTTQFQNTADLGTLNANTKTRLDYVGWPRFPIAFKIFDVGNAYINARPGNDCVIHVGDVYLPGGKRGYRGVARMVSLAYDNSDRSVAALVDVPYVPS